MSKVPNKDLKTRALAYVEHFGVDYGLGDRKWKADELLGDSDSMGRVRLTDEDEGHVIVAHLDRNLQRLTVEVVWCPGCGNKFHDRAGFREQSVKRALNRLEQSAVGDII